MRKVKHSLLILVAFLILSIIPLNVKAAETTEKPTGYQKPTLEQVELSGDDLQHMIRKTYKNRSYAANKWDKYSNNYFYDQLNSRQKELYNSLYNVCMDYLVNNSDASSAGYTAFVAVPAGTTRTELEIVYMLMMTNCPQFYFLENSARFSGTESAITSVCLGMYSDFISGASRRQATAVVEQKLNTWTARINTKSSKLAKEIEAHNIICENTEYTLYSSYHQSSAGVFLEGKAVCAGYAEAFQMLCQGVGIQTLTVTSAEHEWNLVNLYENWYHVDTTWDGTGDTDFYLNISDAKINTDNADHVIETMPWAYLSVPACYYDTVINTVYNGVNYAAVYDDEYYLARYPDIARAYAGREDEAIAHFVNYGMKEGRQGCAGFDVQSYRRRYADLRSAYGNDLKLYYLHYINHGQREGRQATNCPTLQGGVTKLNGVDYSAVFDFNYYTSAYSDIKRIYGDDDIGALNHFVSYGMKEGRQGSSNFNVVSYLYRYSDLRKAFGSNLPAYYEHYMKYGRRENRQATGCSTMQGAQTVYDGVDYSAVYDYNYYTGKYSDIKRAYGYDDYKVLQHFVNYGMKEGRQGIGSFEVRSYYNRYADLRKVFGTDWKCYYSHYITHGRKEGRTAINCASLQNAATIYDGVNYAAVYNYEYYISKYPDVARAFGGDDNSTLRHFVNYGMNEGRQGTADFNVHNYAARYSDLRNAYGNNLKSYYIHYMNHGMKEGRSGK